MKLSEADMTELTDAIIAALAARAGVSFTVNNMHGIAVRRFRDRETAIGYARQMAGTVTLDIVVEDFRMPAAVDRSQPTGMTI